MFSATFFCIFALIASGAPEHAGDLPSDQVLSPQRIQSQRSGRPSFELLSRSISPIFSPQNNSVYDAIELHPHIVSTDLSVATGIRPLRYRGLPGPYLDIQYEGLSLSSGAFSTSLLGLLSEGGFSELSIEEGAGSLANPGSVGTLSLRPPRLRSGSKHSLSLGAGSTFRRFAFGGIALGTKEQQASLQIHYRGDQGDYLFYDDRQTFQTQDDTLGRRQNNDENGVALVFDVQRFGFWRPKLSTIVAFRDFAIAGRQQTPIERARGDTLEAATRISVYPRQNLELSIDARFANRNTKDPRGELGLPVENSRQFFSRVGTGLRWDILNTQHSSASFSGRVAFEHYQANSSYGLSTNNSKFSAGQFIFSYEQNLRVLPWLYLQGRLMAAVEVAQSDVTLADSAQFTPALALGIQRSFGEFQLQYQRLARRPTVTERFGDGEGQLPSQNLLPESGHTLALEYQGMYTAGTNARFWLSASVFANRLEQQIIVLPSGPQSLRAENLLKTENAGFDVDVRMHYRIFRTHLSYTLHLSRDRSALLGIDGRALPGQPRHRALAEVKLGPSWLQLSYRFRFQSMGYFDRSNLQPYPARVRHDVLLRTQTRGHFFAELSVLNLANERAGYISSSDGTMRLQGQRAVRGYPSPGLQWMLSVGIAAKK